MSIEELVGPTPIIRFNALTPLPKQINYLKGLNLNGLEIEPIGDIYRRLSIDTRIVKVEKTPYEIVTLPDGSRTPTHSDGCIAYRATFDIGVILHYEMLPFPVQNGLALACTTIILPPNYQDPRNEKEH